MAAGTIVATLLLAWASVASAATVPRVQAFRAFDDGARIQYRIVLCAPLASKVRFTTYLTAQNGMTYVSPDWTGQQENVCPMWRFSEPDRYRKGRYTAQVRIDVDGERLRTPTRRLMLR